MEKPDKSQIDPAIRRRIQELIKDFKPDGYNPDLVEDILINGLKLLTDVQDRGDVRVIRTALREMRYSYRLFAPYNHKAQGDNLRLRPHAPDQTGISASRRVREA